MRCLLMIIVLKVHGFLASAFPVMLSFRFVQYNLEYVAADMFRACHQKSLYQNTRFVEKH